MSLVGWSQGYNDEFLNQEKSEKKIGKALQPEFLQLPIQGAPPHRQNLGRFLAVAAAQLQCLHNFQTFGMGKVPRGHKESIRSCFHGTEFHSEITGLHLGLKRGVGRRHDADTSAPFSRIAESLIGPVLQEAEQLGLNLGWKFADLIEERCASISFADKAKIIAFRTTEGATNVPEKLGSSVPAKRSVNWRWSEISL